MQNSQKIGQILFKKIFIGYVLIASLLTIFHIYIEYSFAKDSVIKELKTIEKAFYGGIVNSIWHLDEEQIKANTRAIKSIQGIIGVSIISSNNEILSQIGKIGLDHKQFTTFLYEKNENISFEKNLIKHSFEIIHNEFSPDESLGTVFIYTSESAIYNIVKESLILIFIYSFIIVLVLWFLFNHFSNKYLTQPLTQIIHATQKLSTKKYQEISLNSYIEERSELNTLVDTFNTMSKRIVESFSKLKKQKQELINANQYQTDFLANISHEFKTPLNSINVISSIMSKNSENNLNEKQIQNMKIINKSGQDLLVMINDILDMSKLEAGELQLSLETFSIQELLIGLYERMSPLAKEKGIRLTQQSTLENYSITSDKKIITHVVQNLLSNAIKFTNEGAIQLKISENDHFIIINVIDSGIGIAENKIENIFDRFKQVDGSTKRKYGGTGLGLAISKDFALFIKGELTVTSELSQGSNFQFSFPKTSTSEKDTPKQKSINTLPQTKIATIEEKTKQSEEKTVQEIVLLNSDPVLFISLVIKLKEIKNISLTTFNQKKELDDYLHHNTPSILIIDTQIIDEELKNNIINHSKLKVIGLSKTKDKIECIDSIATIPINVDEIINLCKEL